MFQAHAGAVPKPQAGRALCFVPTPPPCGGGRPPPPKADVTHAAREKSASAFSSRARGSPVGFATSGCRRLTETSLVLVFISGDVYKDFKWLPLKEPSLIYGPRLKAE